MARQRWADGEKKKKEDEKYIINSINWGPVSENQFHFTIIIAVAMQLSSIHCLPHHCQSHLLARNVALEQLQTAIDEYGGNHKSRKIRMDRKTNGRQTERIQRIE